MTVRQRMHLAKALATPGLAKLEVQSAAVGELQLQVLVGTGQESIFIRREVWTDLLSIATQESWKNSSSLLNAVRLGHLRVNYR